MINRTALKRARKAKDGAYSSRASRGPSVVLPTPERAAKATTYIHYSKDGPTTVRDAPLERLHAEWERGRGVIDKRLYQAGEKLRIHWIHGGLSERYASLDMNRVFGGEAGAGMPTSEAAMHHREQYRAAQRELGMVVASHVENIVCRDIETATVGKAMGYNNDPQARAAAQQTLVIALDRLARMWGIC